MTSTAVTDKPVAGIRLYTYHGTVTDSKIWSSTQVSGGGGSASTPVSISSKTTTHEQFFLRNANGEEKSFEFEGWTLAVRQGHHVSIVWGIKRGNDRGPVLAAYNHDTREVAYAPGGVTVLTQNMLAGCSMLVLGLIGVLIVALALFAIQFIANANNVPAADLAAMHAVTPVWLGWLIFGALCIGASVWMFKVGKDRVRTLRSAVQSFITQVRGMPIE